MYNRHILVCNFKCRFLLKANNKTLSNSSMLNSTDLSSEKGKTVFILKWDKT